MIFSSLLRNILITRVSLGSIIDQRHRAGRLPEHIARRLHECRRGRRRAVEDHEGLGALLHRGRGLGRRRRGGRGGRLGRAGGGRRLFVAPGGRRQWGVDLGVLKDHLVAHVLVGRGRDDDDAVGDDAGDPEGVKKPPGQPARGAAETQLASG